MAYVPLAKLGTQKGYIPLAKLPAPVDYRGTLGEIKSPYSFGMQTSTQAIPDATTPSTADFVKDLFVGKDNTAGGIARNTVLGLPQALKDVLLPGRGYTDAELKAARPTLTESALGIPKIVAEFSSFLGGLLGSSDSPTLAQKFSQTPLGSKLATAGQKITEFGVPKTAGQAQAMRIGDVLTLIPIGSIKISATAAETIARTKNVKTIFSTLKSEIPNLTDNAAEGLARVFVDIDNVDDVQRAVNKIDFSINAARKADTAVVPFEKPNTYTPLASRVAPESAPTAPITPKVDIEQIQSIRTKAFEELANAIGDTKAFEEASIKTNGTTAILRKERGLSYNQEHIDAYNSTLKVNDPLATEARKYKSAEEFVNSQFVKSNQDNLYQEIRQLAREVKNPEQINDVVIKKFGVDPEITLYRGVNKGLRASPFESDTASKVGRFWSPNKVHSEIFVRGDGKMYEIKVKASDLLRSRLNKTTELAEREIRLGNELQQNATESLTKSQLTDLWNKANKVTKPAEKIKAPKVLTQVEQDLANLKSQIEYTKDAVADMPGRQLEKYVSPETGELPEITGKDVSGRKLDIRGRGRDLRLEFSKNGDDIIQDLIGQELSQGGDVTIGQEMVDAYKNAKTNLEQLKNAYKAKLVQAKNAYRDAKIVTQDEKILNELGDKVIKANEKLNDLAKKIQAQIRLRGTVEQKALAKWENVREAMNLPPISKMTSEQFDQLNDVLSQYKTGDEFLPVRQLETIDRTELTGLRTVREVQEHLAGKYKLTPDQLPGIKPHPWMYDNQLARQHPLYDLLVDKYNVSYLNATSRIIELEKENSALIKAARASRPQGVAGKVAPTDKKIVEWLEAPPETRATMESSMTGAEVKASKEMDEVFHEYYDWLSKRSIEGKFESRFEDKYFPHVRRGFLEAWKEDGFLKGLKEQFDQFKQEERMLTILDSKTGEILPYEKWIGFSQFRSGGLVPTQNAARAFKTYITALEKARQFDEFIPEMMIYVHSLSPRGLTARGVELDDSLKRFVKTWINSKKGRVQQQIIKQGSRMDWALRMGVSLTRIRDLGLNIPVGIANIFGEQVTNLTMLGAKNYSIGAARLATSKGRAITSQYENFIGRTLWDSLGEASNTIGDQFLGGMYGLFGAASRKGNQIFLLGNMTAEEFAKGVISVERLAQLRKGMGKYRVVEGAESVFGKSIEGAIGGQYKKWAIPILVSTASNARILAKNLRTQGLSALKSEEGSELFYTVLVGSVVGLGTMGYYQELADKKDRNFVEDVIYKSTRDAMTLIGALDPKFIGSFAAPRLASFITDLTEAIDNLILLEKYKTTGDFKGVSQLQRILTPSLVTQVVGKEDTISPSNGLPKKSSPGGGGLPKKRP